MDNLWRIIDCYACGGHGMRMVGDGMPFECGECSMGKIYIRPTGHIFQYPGGPARGMWSAKKYKEGIQVDERK